MSKVCAEKSAESSNMWVIVAVALVFVLLVLAFAARFRHRIYVFVMPQAAQPDVISFKGAENAAVEERHAPLAVPVIDKEQLVYALKFNK
jgi:hypothetical protein